MEHKKTKHLSQVQDQFIEKIADNMRMFGVSTTVGRILGIIYMNRAPMTLDQLSEASGMSKTRMSQVVREMIDLNIAERVYEKDVRKDLYDVEQDYYQTFISLLSTNWRDAIHKSKLIEQRWAQNIMEAKREDSLDSENEEKIENFVEEIHAWSQYYDWISRLIDFLESGEVFKHVPKQFDTNEPSAIEAIDKQQPTSPKQWR